MERNWRGIFAIPVTPFTDGGDLDEESLRNEIRFCAEAGAHGIVVPVIASEFAMLSDDERKRIVKIAVEEARGRAPVVAGVSAANKELAVAFARHASEVGADAVIALPPYLNKPATEEDFYGFYRAISDAVGVPIFLFNGDKPPFGTPMTVSLMAKMLREIPRVEYLKEEVQPENHRITAILEAAGPHLKGVFGGIGGIYLLDELARGAHGVMPACEVADVHVDIWDACQRGDLVGARRIFNTLMPLIRLETLLGFGLCKEVLKRRGVISSTYMRTPGTARLDRHDLRELDAIWEDVAPLFRIR